MNVYYYPTKTCFSEKHYTKTGKIDLSVGFHELIRKHKRLIAEFKLELSALNSNASSTGIRIVRNIQAP